MIIQNRIKFKKKFIKTAAPSDLLSSGSGLERDFSLLVHWRFQIKNIKIVSDLFIQIIWSHLISNQKPKRYFRLLLSVGTRILVELIYLLLRNNDSIW